MEQKFSILKENFENSEKLRAAQESQLIANAAEIKGLKARVKELEDAVRLYREQFGIKVNHHDETSHLHGSDQ